MRYELKAAMIVLTLLAAPLAAQAGPVEGAAFGAVTGAVIAGPPGAIVGGVIGATVGGPDIVRRDRRCWTNRDGYRQCARR